MKRYCSKLFRLRVGQKGIFWSLAATTGIGSVIAAPFAAPNTGKANYEKLKAIMGLTTILVGAYTLLKTYTFGGDKRPI